MYTSAERDIALAALDSGRLRTEDRDVLVSTTLSEELSLAYRTELARRLLTHTGFTSRRLADLATSDVFRSPELALLYLTHEEVTPDLALLLMGRNAGLIASESLVAYALEHLSPRPRWLSALQAAYTYRPFAEKLLSIGDSLSDPAWEVFLRLVGDAGVDDIWYQDELLRKKAHLASLTA